MKTLISLLLLCATISVYAQNDNPNYDAELAKKMGADAYGMKPYVLVLLKTGSNKDTVKATMNESFRGHMENIRALVKANKLIVAGPLGSNPQAYRGIFILDVKTIAEAKTVLATDPAIQQKYLDADLFEWYGSAALAAYLDASDKIWKIKP